LRPRYQVALGNAIVPEAGLRRTVTAEEAQLRRQVRAEVQLRHDGKEFSENYMDIARLKTYKSLHVPDIEDRFWQTDDA
jgi:hypothetical protein